MLITQAAGGTGNILPCSDTTSTLCQASIWKSTHVNPLVITCVASSGYSNGRSTAGLHCCSISSKSSSGGLCHHLSRVAPKKSLCRLHEDSTSPDDEYRSSRNIAVTLFRRYKNFIDRGGADILTEFIGAGVIAYALGCTDEGLKKELTDMKESGFKIEGMQCYGGNTSLKSKILFEEATIVRWSSTPPVSEEVMLEWRGFCALIANAYYVRGMAWLPVKILQLEQMAVVGRAEEPSIVASRMQLVFSTLEVVSPQWPRV